MTGTASISSTTRQDRLIAIAAIVAVSVLSWFYIVTLAQGMSNMDTTGAAVQIQITSWTTADLILLFVMWTIMMIGMMLPSAVPLILNFLKEKRQTQQAEGVFVSTPALVVGYVAIWTGFSVVATLGEWALHETALLGWRKGTGGAFVMGLEHGAYCLGCCFVLMGVLFVGGVMNLLLLAIVTAFVLLEKALPFGNVAGLVSGPLMIAAGIYLLV
jgi:predicted metal-binding membrane protein